MQARLLIISIVISAFFTPVFFASGTQINPPLIIDKTDYEIEDTVVINITILPEHYSYYYFSITANAIRDGAIDSGSFTYKGEFNDVMFFYPTEEAIYTAALVDKATGAIFFSESFKVTDQKKSVRAVIGGIDQKSEEPIDDPGLSGLPSRISPDIDPELIQGSGSEAPAESAESLGESLHDYFFIDKKEYVLGEIVQLVPRDSERIEELEDLSIYYVHGDSVERYFGSSGTVSFRPDAIGEQEIVVMGPGNIVLKRYLFTVLAEVQASWQPFATQKKLVRIRDFYRQESNALYEFYDKKGKRLGDAEVNELGREKEWGMKLKLQGSTESFSGLVLNNVSLDADGEVKINLEDLPLSIVKKRGQLPKKAFVIDASQALFQNGSFSSVAQGDELWKCKDWLFDERKCVGAWTKVSDLVRGQEYSIEIHPEDPAFIEVIRISSALHLNSQRETIRDISESVNSLDGVLARIGDGDFVRVFFEENLTSDKDITVFASSSSSARIEVYAAGQDSLLAAFEDVTQFRKYRILLTSLFGAEDAFDLKIITDAGGWVDFDYIVDPVDILPPSTREGLLVYTENGVLTPMYRVWNGSAFGLEGSANDIGGLPEWMSLASSPNNDEYVLATADDVDDINVQFYSYINSSTLCWHNGTSCSGVWQFVTASTTQNYNKVTVGYEQSSGDILLVYVDASPNPDVARYRTWNGTDWSTENTVPQTLLTGEIEAVKLAERPNSDELALVLSDSLNDANTIIWNGTAWECEPAGLLTATLFATAHPGTFDLAYEQVSGDLLVVLSDASLTEIGYAYKQAGACSYTSMNTTTLTIRGQIVSVNPQYGSDYMLVGVRAATGEDSQAIVWNGSSMINESAADATNYADGALNMIISAGWAGMNDTGILVYSDATAANLYTIDYMLYNKTSGDWTGGGTGLHTNGTGGVTNFTLADRGYQSMSFMDQDMLLTIFQDDANDLWAKYFDRSTLRWLDADGGVALETESIAGTLELPAFSFTWKKVTQLAPNISFVFPTDSSGMKYNRSCLIINVSADDINYRNMTLFIYNSSGGLINISNTTQKNLYLNQSDLSEGMYFFNATACDAVGNCNFTETRNVTLSLDSPEIFFTEPTENSSSYIERLNIYINVTANDRKISMISISFYNSSKALISSNSSSASPFFWNVTVASEGIYYFNASVIDKALNMNITETRNATVDLYYPSVWFNNNTDNSSQIMPRNYILINVSANDTFLKNISITVINSTGSIVRFSSTESGTLFYNASGLGDGLYYFNSTACDAAGKCNCTEQRNITIDKKAPEVYYAEPTDESGSAYERQYIIVNATASDIRFQNLTITLFNESGSIFNQSSTTQQGLYVNFSSIPEGVYFFNASACDVVGNCNSTELKNVTIDLSYPIIQFIFPTDISGDSDARSYILVNASADDKNFKNVSIFIYNSSGAMVRFQSANEKILFYNATGLLPDVYYFNATACDKAGKCNQTEKRNFSLIDIDYPIVYFDWPTDASGNLLDRAYIVMNATASDASLKNITINVYTSSGSLVFYNTTVFSNLFWNATGFYDGLFYFNATACDVSGKCNDTETRNVTIDDAYYPRINYTAPTDISGSYFARDYLRINVTCEDINLKNLTITIYNATGSIVNNSEYNLSLLEESRFFQGINMPDGLYFFNSTVCDWSANCNSTETWNVTLDTIGPVIAIERPGNSEIINSTNLYTMNATANDYGIGLIDTVIFQYRKNSTESWGLACNDSDGLPFECIWNLSEIIDGDEYEVQAYSNDTLGNIGAPDQSSNITIDRFAPSITVLSPENLTSYGSKDVLFRYMVSDLGSDVLNCTLIWQNNLNDTEEGPLAEGSEYNFLLQNITNGNYTWGINCTDEFGHTGTSGVFNITVEIRYYLDLNVTSDKQYYDVGTLQGDIINISTNSYGFFGNFISDVNITTDLLKVSNLTDPVGPWWNTSWKMRKPIFLSTASSTNIINARVVVNVTGLAGNISNCTSEIRIASTSNVLITNDILGGDNFDYCEIAFIANISANTTNENKYFVYYNNSASSAGNPANTVQASYPILFESFEGAGWNLIANEDPGLQCAGGSGLFNGCTDFTVSMDFAATTGSAFPITGSRILVFDQTRPWAANRGIYHGFDAETSCGGDDCDDIFVTGYVATASIDSSGEFSMVWARNENTLSYTVVFQCVGPAPACEFTGADNTLPSQLSHYSFFNKTLKESLGISLTSTMFVHIAGVGSAEDDNFYFEDINITGIRKQAPNVTAAYAGSHQSWIGSMQNITDILGFSSSLFNATGTTIGNYSAVSRGIKANYSSAFNYTFFQIINDGAGPLTTLLYPESYETIDPFSISYAYALNSSVSDLSNSTVQYYYRNLSTNPWIYICNGSQSPGYSCTWNLTGLGAGDQYEVMALGVDYYGNSGNNDTHFNITMLSGHAVNVIHVRVEDNITLPVDEIDLAAGGIRAVQCNISVFDDDNYSNILGINSTMYYSGVTPSSPDDNKTHYTNSSCLLIWGEGNVANYHCNFEILYFASNGSWICRAEAFNNYSSDYLEDNTTVNQLMALNISSSIINYNDVQAESESGDVAINITNLGNIPINISVYGFGGEDESSGKNLSMICAINNLSVSLQRFSTTVIPYSSKINLSSTPKDVGLSIPPAETYGDLMYNTTYWQLRVPASSYSFGQCNGSLVFSATAG